MCASVAHPRRRRVCLVAKSRSGRHNCLPVSGRFGDRRRFAEHFESLEIKSSGVKRVGGQKQQMSGLEVLGLTPRTSVLMLARLRSSTATCGGSGALQTVNREQHAAATRQRRWLPMEAFPLAGSGVVNPSGRPRPPARAGVRGSGLRGKHDVVVIAPACAARAAAGLWQSSRPVRR